MLEGNMEEMAQTRERAEKEGESEMTEELKGQDQKRGIQVHDKDRGEYGFMRRHRGKDCTRQSLNFWERGRKLADRLARPLCAVLVGE